MPKVHLKKSALRAKNNLFKKGLKEGVGDLVQAPSNQELHPEEGILAREKKTGSQNKE